MLEGNHGGSVSHPSEVKMSDSKALLIERLRREQQRKLDHETAGTLDEWLSAVQRLLDQLRAWVGPVEAEGLLVVEPIELTRDEPELCRYRVPGLKLSTPTGHTVRIAPRARFVLGALGRVDLLSPSHKLRLLRVEPDRWVITRLSSDAPGWTQVELSEATFWQAIETLLA
jgi:hypothetical protein